MICTAAVGSVVSVRYAESTYPIPLNNTYAKP
jgi:hypothetical protein